jgi:hypothetical protein
MNNSLKVTTASIALSLLAACSWQPNKPQPAPIEPRSIIVTLDKSEITVNGVGCFWPSVANPDPQKDFLYCFSYQDYQWSPLDEQWVLGSMKNVIFTGIAKAWRFAEK